MRTPDPTSGPPAPTPQPAAQAVPGELTVVWEATGCGVGAIAPIFEQRLISVGFCDAQSGSRSVVWETRTGFEWRRVFETEPDVTLWALSTDGNTGGALIGGWDANTTPQMWRGDIFDGFDQNEPTTLSTEDGYAMVRGIEWGDGDYLAIGLEQRQGEERNPPVAWHYTDTGPWTLIAPPPDATELDDVTYGPDPNTYTVGGATNDFKAAIWRLSNGTTWTTAIELPAGLDQAAWTLLDAHTVLGRNALWEENEDGEWQLTQLPSGVDAYTGVLLDDGLLVFGSKPDASDNPEVVVLAAGADRRWGALDIDPSDRRKLIRSAVLFDDRVIAAGDAIWMGPDSIGPYLR
ncbi:MAG TPA: hypothetical protein VMZ66_09240 [Aeromicrobium sp.]|nr:hypothetical protein [Aeromicrobium sp.]